MNLSALQSQAQAENKICVVGALIMNKQGKVFVQKRSATRKLFPNCWDIAGGHVEQGESLEEALAREIQEETGWALKKIVDLVMMFDWESDGTTKCEFDFLVEVEGDLDHPQIETEKFSEWRWVGENEIEILKENRDKGYEAIYDVVRKVIELTQKVK